MPNNLTDAEEMRLLDLGLLDTDKLALVTTLPTDSVAGTEVTGGSYARQVIDWAPAAAGGSKTTAAAIVFSTMPAAEVVAWEVYDTTGAQRKWYGLWTPKSGSSTAATDLVNATAHGFVDGNIVVFQSGYVPTGLTAGTKYYVRDATTNTFKVALTLAGVAVDLTADTASIIVGKVLEVGSGSGVNIAIGGITCSLS